VILVDTSVWVDHLRRGNTALGTLLEAGEVVGHSFVAGELACGSIKNRREVLALLDNLPQATVADHGEVLRLVDSRKLMGRGLGYIDVHLLASALLTGARLWTLDNRLSKEATRLNVSA
jgi:predicted nucleic acid-binding protein